jgi:hypothetical protein
LANSRKAAARLHSSAGQANANQNQDMIDHGHLDH